MADRYPLIVDSSTSTVKEIASGDNLNLSGNGVVNAGNIDASGVSVTNASVSGILTVGVGTTGSLSLVGGNNTKDGIFFPADGRVSVAAGGSEAIRITHVQAVGMNTVGFQTTVYQPVISIGNGDQDLSPFDSAGEDDYKDRYPLLHIDDSSRRNRNAPGANPNEGGGVQQWGFGSDYVTPVAGGRMQASLASAHKIWQVIIPVAEKGKYYALCRNDVAGFRGTIDVEVSDAVGGATSTLRGGYYGAYGNNTGFTTLAKSVGSSANGGDVGVGFSAITLTTLGIATDAGAGLAVRWTASGSISTDFAALNITLVGYNANVAFFRAGAFATG